MKRIFPLIAALALLIGCSAPKEAPALPSPTPAAPARTYALVVKDVTNPYMQRMFAGFEEACSALGASALFEGPSSATAEGQIAAIEGLILKGVEAIAVAANDREALSEVLQRAIAAGIKVVSLDSDVKPEDRTLHVQQASPEVIGRVLVQAAREMIGGNGAIAILTTTDNASNQRQWLSWMLKELRDNPALYENMPLVDTLYGLDLYAPSYAQVTQLLRSHPEVRIVIAPTSVGILAAADAIRDSASPALVTGLGLPSDMGDHIRSGICPWMYLWNPIDVGYVAAYAADALVAGKIGGEAGEVLSAGSYGIMKVTPAADGGSEIVVGNPTMFDSTNVAVWEEIF